MPQPVSPREPPPRSIYERLGLTPTLDPKRKVVIAASRPPMSRAMRSLSVLLIGLALAGMAWLMWQGLPATRIEADSGSDAQIDAQQLRIQRLDQRVEMLEVKVVALQKLAGFQNIDAPRSERDSDDPSESPAKPRKHVR